MELTEDKVRDLTRSYRSDRLMSHVKLLQRVQAPLEPMPSFHLVVDTSAAIADLIFIVAKRRQPDARPDLLEVAAMGPFAFLAPTEIEAEIHANIPDLAEEFSLPAEQFVAAWCEYRKALRLVEVEACATGNPDWRLRDPTDAPFVHLLHNAGAAAILSLDNDLLDSNAPTIRPAELLRHLREYGRGMSVAHGLECSGLIAASLGVAICREVGTATVKSLRSLRRVPPAAWLVIAAVAGLVMLHPGSRRRLSALAARGFHSFKDVSRRALPPLFDGFSLLQQIREKERQEADERWLAARGALIDAGASAELLSREGRALIGADSEREPRPANTSALGTAAK